MNDKLTYLPPPPREVPLQFRTELGYIFLGLDEFTQSELKQATPIKLKHLW
jgi:hypothetical protein